MTHDGIHEAVPASLEDRVRDAIKGVPEEVMEIRSWSWSPSRPATPSGRSLTGHRCLSEKAVVDAPWAFAPCNHRAGEVA